MKNPWTTINKISISRGYSVFTIECCLWTRTIPRNQLSLTVLSGHRWKPWQQSQNRSWHDCSLDKDITHKWFLLFSSNGTRECGTPLTWAPKWEFGRWCSFSNIGFHCSCWLYVYESLGHFGRNLAAKPTLRSIYFAPKFRNLEIHPFFHHFALHRCFARFDVMGCLMAGEGGAVSRGSARWFTGGSLRLVQFFVYASGGVFSFFVLPVQYYFCINETAKQAV